MRLLLRPVHYGKRRLEAGQPVPPDVAPEVLARWEHLGVVGPDSAGGKVEDHADPAEQADEPKPKPALKKRAPAKKKQEA